MRRRERWVDDEQLYEDPTDRYTRKIGGAPNKRYITVWQAYIAYPMMLLSIVPYLGFVMTPITAVLCYTGIKTVNANKSKYKGKRILKIALWFCAVGALINYGGPLILFLSYLLRRY
jgi:hypothetical protein